MNVKKPATAAWCPPVRRRELLLTAAIAMGTAVPIVPMSGGNFTAHRARR
jgi:hypothetical protein